MNGFRCWSALKSGLSADEIASAHDVMLERMDAEFGTLKRLETLVTAAEATFPGAASAKEMDPAATADAVAAEAEAAENAQVMHLPRIIVIIFIARLTCQWQGASADKLQVKAATCPRCRSECAGSFCRRLHTRMGYFLVCCCSNVCCASASEHTGTCIGWIKCGVPCKQAKVQDGLVQ